MANTSTPSHSEDILKDKDNIIATLEEELKRALNQVDLMAKEVAHKDSEIQKTQKRYYDIVEQNNYERKRQANSLPGKLSRISTDHRDGLLVEIVNRLGTDDPNLIIPNLDRLIEKSEMEKIVNELIAKVLGTLDRTRSEKDTVDALHERINELLHDAEILSQIRDKIGIPSRSDHPKLISYVDALLKLSREPQFVDSKELNRLRELEDEIRQLFKLSVPSDKIIPYLHRLHTKTTEFNSFYKQLCNQLDLPITNSYTPSYAKCMNKVNELIQKPHQPLGHADKMIKFAYGEGSESDTSPIGTMNLAFAREIVQIP
jgi:hypothetical protein